MQLNNGEKELQKGNKQLYIGEIQLHNGEMQLQKGNKQLNTREMQYYTVKTQC